MRFPLAIATLLLLSSSVLWPQAHTERGQNRNSFEVYGGYAAAFGGAFGNSTGFNAGFDAALRGPFYLVADVTHVGDTGQEVVNRPTDTAILVGPRYRKALAGSRVALFADGLVGVDKLQNNGQMYTHIYNGSAYLAFALQAGMELPIGHRVSIRGQGGYQFSRLSLSNDSGAGPSSLGTVSNNRGRIAVMVVYRF